MSTTYLLAWLIAALAGIIPMFGLSASMRAGRFATVCGYGIVFGMLLAAASVALTARADTTQAWIHAAPWLAAFALAIAAVAYWLRRGAAAAPATQGADEGASYWPRLVALVALASLIWRGSILASEALLRPTFPWDAWDAWAVKSKTWFLLGHYATFVAPADWLAHADAELYTGPAWAYPSALGWLQLWFASAAGDWIEPLVNLPWAALWLGLLLGHYGQWRALGLDRTRALIFVYVLGSLPLLGTHVALAGYADLWVATIFGFGVLAWLRWQEQRDGAQLALAVICAAILPLLKLEGIVWCLTLLAAIGFGALPLRWRWRSAWFAAAVLVTAGVIGKSDVLFAAIGWVRSGSRVVDIPAIGTLKLAWHGAAAVGVVRSLFVQSNWHLLWWLVVPVVAWRWRALRANDALSLCALLLLACLGLLVFLFVFTDASNWAESYTAVNRLIMHITPATVTLLALLLREPPALAGSTHTTRARDRLPGPA
jgi:hypothetical protein